MRVMSLPMSGRIGREKASGCSLLSILFDNTPLLTKISENGFAPGLSCVHSRINSGCRLF